MSNETQAIVSLILSVLACSVSFFALGWTIYRDVLDKGRLRLELMIGKLLPCVPGGTPMFVSSDVHAEMVNAKETPDDAGPHLLIATITNVGRRPIVAMKWAGRRWLAEGTKEWFVFKPRTLPKTLQPGEFTMDWTENPIVFKQNVQGFYVFDSAGRQWAVKRRNIQAFKVQAREILGEGATR